MTALLIPGTHSRAGPGVREWWHADQALPRAFRAHGYTTQGFPWTTDLDGVLGPNRRWRDAGEKLGLWLQVAPASVVLAHSHGGNIVPSAILENRLAHIDVLVTCGTPVRLDMAEVYRRMMRTGRVGKWLHVWSEWDGWQWWGSVKLWPPSPATWAPWKPRIMAAASENRCAGDVGHHGLLRPDVLGKVGLWSWLQ